MKLLYALPILGVLPVSAFAESDSYHIKPFIGYNLSLASSYNGKLKDDTGTVVKSDSFDFNDNNVGDFVLGVEIADVVAISINPSLSQTKTKVSGAGTTTAKMNEIDAEVDVYLMRNSNFKPYVSLAAGYVSMDGDVRHPRNVSLDGEWISNKDEIRNWWNKINSKYGNAYGFNIEYAEKGFFEINVYQK